ncbi:hypothetical protein CHS0354_013426 [Potamilus streckersoni]|uniref:Uncharacterized protein n=1 Tax=Potamilus streckersoni TaxID=2493646 RepID=A0AAE0RV03_9BIVA|nr:hypothetical protein CHS0354_013426 [Potamilus streckersoni]
MEDNSSFNVLTKILEDEKAPLFLPHYTIARNGQCHHSTHCKRAEEQRKSTQELARSDDGMDGHNTSRRIAGREGPQILENYCRKDIGNGVSKISTIKLKAPGE